MISYVLRFEKRIYIPLPDYKGRLALLQNRLKDTPCSLRENEMEELVNMLEGYMIMNINRYSGSDMNTLIRDASFEPLRKCERAKSFKKVLVNG